MNSDTCPKIQASVTIILNECLLQSYELVSSSFSSLSADPPFVMWSISEGVGGNSPSGLLSGFSGGGGSGASPFSLIDSGSSASSFPRDESSAGSLFVSAWEVSTGSACPFDTAGDCGREGEVTGGVGDGPASKSMFDGSGEGLTGGNVFSVSAGGLGVVGRGDRSVEDLEGAARLNMWAKRDVVEGGGEASDSARCGCGRGDRGSFVCGPTRFSCTTISSIAVGALTFLSPESFSCRKRASAKSLNDRAL